MSNPLLSLNNIKVHFKDKIYLNIINLDLNRGEVHAIIGESGAGKTLLGKLLKTQLLNSSGTFTYRGQTHSKLTRIKNKPSITMVPQHLILHQAFIAGEYLYHNKFSKHIIGFSSRKRFVSMAKRDFHKYGFDIDPFAQLKNLNQSDIAILELLNKLEPIPELLIIDEMFSKINSADLVRVYEILKDYSQKGGSVLFFTTKISYIYDIAERVSIIKNGEIIFSDKIDSIDKINLIRLTYTNPSLTYNMEELNKSFYHFLKFNEAILESLPSNIIVTNRQMEIIMVNNYFKKYFNIENEDYLKSRLNDFFAKNNNSFLQIIEESSNTNQIHSFYHVPMIIGNRQTSVNIKILPITEDGMNIGNIFLIEDVSELVTLQEKLILAQNLSSIGILSAGIAHEINNSLEALNSFSNLLLFKRTKSEDIELYDHIREELDFIENVVDNLISFSDKNPTKNDYVNIYETTAQIISFIKHNPQYDGLRINLLNKLEDLAFCPITQNEYKQIMLNLIRNSNDVLTGNGEINITLENTNDKLKLTFEDNGPGISADIINDIFLPFFSTKTKTGTHLGMGLSIIHSIITKHEGNITIGRDIGKGAQFLIELPVITP